MISATDFPSGDWILLSLGKVSRSPANSLLDTVSLKLGQVDIDHLDAAPTAHLSREVPVSLLPQMKVGTIWRNGTSVATFLGLARTRKYGGIGTAAVSGFVKLFVGSYPQPPPATGVLPGVVVMPPRFPSDFLGQNNDGQNAIEVRARDSFTDKPVVLIIPCWEIFRFYFCTSAIMSREIFRYGLMPTNNLYDETSSRKVDGRSRLVLRSAIPVADAATVLRIAFDETAGREARHCALGILVQLCRKVPAHPKVGLPFS